MTKELSIIDQTKKLIINNEKAFEAVLPKNFDVQKFIATFCLEVQKNPKLAECTNLIEVARDVANFGLVIGGLANQAYLIPFEDWKTKKYKAQLIIGYRGYITKLEEAGYTVEVEIVTNEEVDKGFFEELRGSETKIIHRPIRKGIRDRDSIALAYCIIKGQNTPPVIAVLSKEEIEEIGKTEKWNDSTKKKERTLSNVWLNEGRTTDFGQQCIKTVIRNAVKKVNLRIANEMSAYEGQRDAEIMKDITPASKTAMAHVAPPTAIEQSFELQVDIEEAINDVEKKEEVAIFGGDKDQEVFERVRQTLESMKTANAIKMYFDKSAAEDLRFLEDNAPRLKSQLIEIKNAKLETLNGK